MTKLITTFAISVLLAYILHRMLDLHSAYSYVSFLLFFASKYAYSYAEFRAESAQNEDFETLKQDFDQKKTEISGLKKFLLESEKKTIELEAFFKNAISEKEILSNLNVSNRAKIELLERQIKALNSENEGLRALNNDLNAKCLVLKKKLRPSLERIEVEESSSLF